MNRFISILKAFCTSYFVKCLGVLLLYLLASVMFLYPAALVASVSPSLNSNHTWFWVGTVAIAMTIPLLLTAFIIASALGYYVVRDCYYSRKEHVNLV
jgi:hypothetical protein